MASNAAVIAGGMVASSVILVVGLYLVLPRPVAPVLQAAPAPVPVAAPRQEAPPVATPEIRAQALQQVQGLLEARRAELVRRCWSPAAAAQPEPRQISLRFNLAYGAAGELVAIGISEDPSAHRSDVANCVRATELAPKIAAPGVPLQLEVPFTLP